MPKVNQCSPYYHYYLHSELPIRAHIPWQLVFTYLVFTHYLLTYLPYLLFTLLTYQLLPHIKSFFEFILGPWASCKTAASPQIHNNDNFFSRWLIEIGCCTLIAFCMQDKINASNGFTCLFGLSVSVSEISRVVEWSFILLFETAQFRIHHNKTDMERDRLKQCYVWQAVKVY